MHLVHWHYGQQTALPGGNEQLPNPYREVARSIVKHNMLLLQQCCNALGTLALWSTDSSTWWQ